ncbi:hypothetical protein L1987_46470 [Smallanthus sonchifolius]|uniref:Uncharacterized protein n=1 Tax=Smallanthus sonchifolius TaxID=185202 RepID=A0ACB9G1K5_9ASTR|nr:hypothetical protein L1987_46470 [Smallanthus sonchifolius]
MDRELIIPPDSSDEFDLFISHGSGSSSLQFLTDIVAQAKQEDTATSKKRYVARDHEQAQETLIKDYFVEENPKYDEVQLYGKEFLRRPTSHDVAFLYNAHEEKHGIPGILGSIDCTHFVWRMCSTRLHGQYIRSDHQYTTIMLEAMASNDLWFWHVFCGPPGSNNDINVLQKSPIFTNEQLGTAPKCSFHVNGREYKHVYYHTEGIYPTWSTFVKSFAYPTNPKERKFKKVQGSARKDVERAFGGLKAKWGILRRPARSHKQEKIRNVVYACMLLHNMIIKDDRKAISPVYIRDPLTDTVIDNNVLSQLHEASSYFRLRFDVTIAVFQDLVRIPPVAVSQFYRTFSLSLSVLPGAPISILLRLSVRYTALVSPPFFRLRRGVTFDLVEHIASMMHLDEE